MTDHDKAIAIGQRIALRIRYLLDRLEAEPGVSPAATGGAALHLAVERSLRCLAPMALAELLRRLAGSEAASGAGRSTPMGCLRLRAGLGSRTRKKCCRRADTHHSIAPLYPNSDRWADIPEGLKGARCMAPPRGTRWTFKIDERESCINVSGLEVEHPAPGHHGYPRASKACYRKDLEGPNWHPVSWLRRADRSSISSFHLADLGGEAVDVELLSLRSDV
jgi:hypothetical protein